MNSKRFRLILLGLLALCIIAFLAIFFLGMSALKSKSQEMVDLKLQNKTADAQLTNLELSKKDISKYSYFKDVVKTVIPNDKDQAQAVLDIFQIAQASGIGIQSITFPTSNLGAGASLSRGATTGADATKSTSSSKIISQAVPVTGIPGLYSVLLTITPVNGPQASVTQQATYAKMIDFLNRIENNRRTAQITQVNIQPATGQAANSNLLNFSMSVNIFIKP